MSNTFAYALGDNLYLNLTNRCPCSCTFCVRNEQDGITKEQSLWLDREPTAAEVITAIEQHDLSKYKELVFCGFGEPTEALPCLLEVAKHIKTTTDKKIRLNTNGLGDLVNKKPIAALLAPYIDIVSVSLNAPEKAEYLTLCRPSFGEGSFEAMLTFAGSCKEAGMTVFFTVVDILGAEKIEACRILAAQKGIPLRIREVIE